MNLTVFLGHFPFGYGESFFENELPYLVGNFEEITLISDGKGKKSRQLPEKVKLVALKQTHLILRLSFLITAMLKPFLTYRGRKEIKQVTLKNMTILKFAMQVLYFYHESLINYNIKKNLNKDKKTIFYAFWMNEAAFAISTKKYPFVVAKICRAHRYDLFYEKNKAKYLPFRENIYQAVNQIHFVTKLGRDYYIQTYARIFDLKNKEEKLKVSYLGVEKNKFSLEKKSIELNSFSIISCSFIHQVKRLDLIIDTISKISDNFQINWTHIGDGEEQQKIQNYAEEKLANKKHINYQFLGNIKNDQLTKNLSESNYDLFVNLSDSEGVPVSIMEAMACGIPVLARNVGGNSEIVTNENGRLIDEGLNSQEIASIIEELIRKNKDNQLLEERQRAFDTWESKYYAENNYKKFVSQLKEKFSKEK
ncbi:MAG: glycosyltransferase [Lactovum sp.]